MVHALFTLTRFKVEKVQTILVVNIVSVWFLYTLRQCSQMATHQYEILNIILH